MKITREWLIDKNACKSGVDYIVEKGWLGLDAVDLVNNLADANKIAYAHWLFKNVLSTKNLQLWAIYGAEQVLPMWVAFDNVNDTPQRAIAAAIAFVENPTDENRRAAADAGEAAWAAAGAAAAIAGGIAGAAADADAAAAAGAAGAVAWAAAAGAAWAVAGEAAGAAWTAWITAKKEMQLKIIKHGIELFQQQKKEE